MAQNSLGRSVVAEEPEMQPSATFSVIGFAFL